MANFIITIAPPHDPVDAFANDFADTPVLPTVETYDTQDAAFARAAELWDADERLFSVREVLGDGSMVHRYDFPHGYRVPAFFRGDE